MVTKARKVRRGGGERKGAVSQGVSQSSARYESWSWAGGGLSTLICVSCRLLSKLGSSEVVLGLSHEATASKSLWTRSTGR